MNENTFYLHIPFSDVITDITVVQPLTDFQVVIIKLINLFNTKYFTLRSIDNFSSF